MLAMKKILITFCALLLAGGWCTMAHAARSYTNTQSPALGTAFDMGSIQSLTYAITNTSDGGNVGERIYEMRFRISSGSLFLSSTAAPAGWTRTAFSSTLVTFEATSWANAIAVGGASVSFTLVVAMRATTADVNETLRDMRAAFTTTTTGPPFPRTGRTTTGTPGGWTLKSLAITSFQITDTLGNPVTAITAGTSFRLVMTVKNNSTVTQSTIVSNPNPPTAVKTGTVTQSLTGTAGSPLSLVAGASGTITFTYSTVTTDSGTIYFTANAQNGATVTSAAATSTTLAISKFTAALSVSSACLYAGASLTVTMLVTNATASTINSVSGTLSPAAGAPVTLDSGPTPASIASMATMTTATVTWVYTVNSAGATNPFTFNGSATGTAGSTLTTPTATSATVKRGIFTATVNPVSTNAGSTNTELTFNVTNSGCANVDSVAVTASAGWTYGSDAYSLVNLSAVSAIETWTTSGANPVTFTAPNIAGQMPVTFSGSYSVVYSATPASATTSAFTIRVTDANGKFEDVPVSVTVNAFKSGTLNNAVNRNWREETR